MSGLLKFTRQRLIIYLLRVVYHAIVFCGVNRGLINFIRVHLGQVCFVVLIFLKMFILLTALFELINSFYAPRIKSFL
jgi:hypothetical protein